MMANDSFGAWKGATGTAANGQLLLYSKLAPENGDKKKIKARNPDFYEVSWFVHTLNTTNETDF